MSRLRELIAELCPDGVEYRQLGEVAPFVRERANTNEARFDAYVGVDALLQNKEGRDLTKTGIPSGRHIYFRPGDTLVGNIRPYLKKIWYADCFGGTNGDVLVFRSTGKVEAKYLYHVLASDAFFDYDNGHARGSKMPRGDKGFIRDYRIPVPPIEVQREIVRILDSFQELDNALTAEIEAREKQFEWMLQEELSISHLNRVESNTVEMRAVRDVREKVITPIRAKPADFEGTIPWCKLEDVVGYEIGDSLSGKSVSEETVASMGLNVYPEGTVLCSCSATLGVYCVTQKPLVTNQRFMGFVCSDEILNRFFMYAMDASTTKLLMQATTGTNAYISRKAFEDHLIPVPTIGVQKRVVEELDSAYHLLNSLRSTRETRRKQFAYYRDKLLAFPELNKEVDE